MTNVNPPTPVELPSPRTLRRATIITLVVAVAVIVGAVLPAERGIDPTGVGRITGLTAMGQMKVEAAKELAAQAATVAARRAADSAAAEGIGTPRR